MNRPWRRFILKLCRMLGRTQWELLEGPGRLSVADLIEWQTEYNIEPFEREEDRRHAMLVTTVARPTGHGEWDEMYAALMPKRSREDFEGATSQDDSPSMEKVFAVLTAVTTTVQGVRPKSPEGEET